MTPNEHLVRNERDLRLRTSAHNHLAIALTHLALARADLVASASVQARDVLNHSIMVQRDTNEVLASCRALEAIVGRQKGTYLKTSRNGALAS